jgi:hypothetical protein
MYPNFPSIHDLVGFGGDERTQMRAADWWTRMGKFGETKKTTKEENTWSNGKR